MNRTLLIAFVCLLCLPLAVSAQNRNRNRNRNTSATPQTKNQISNQLIREDAERVANNIKNLTRFIYLLANVTKDIETIDDAARKKQASRTTIAQNQETKEKLSVSMENWRIAMEELERIFRTKPPLQKYSSKLSGVGRLAAVAQDQAHLGQYNQTAQTFIQILNTLTDVLLEMP